MSEELTGKQVFEAVQAVRRDFFAGQALANGTGSGEPSFTKTARECFRMADAMIKVSAEKKTKEK